MGYTPEVLFPSHAFHLIAGPARAGYDVFAMQVIGAWQAGGYWLDCQFEPSPVCVVSVIHAPMMLRRLMARAGLDAKTPSVSMAHYPRDGEHWSFKGAIELAQRRMDGDGIILLDNMMALCPRQNDESVVTGFLIDAGAICDRLGLTVLATIRASKFGPDGACQSAVERIMGSGTTSVKAGSIIFLDYHKPRDSSNLNRNVHVMPEGGGGVMLSYRLENQRLEETVAAKDAGSSPLDDWLDSLPPGTEVTAAEIVAEAERRDISRATAYKWIKTRGPEDDGLGRLVWVRHGVYTPAEVV